MATRLKSGAKINVDSKNPCHENPPCHQVARKDMYTAKYYSLERKKIYYSVSKLDLTE